MANLFIGIGGSGVKTITSIISKSGTSKKVIVSIRLFI